MKIFIDTNILISATIWPYSVPAQAFELYKQAAEAGSAKGMSSLSWFYQYGVGIPEEMSREDCGREAFYGADAAAETLNLFLVHKYGRHLISVLNGARRNRVGI